MHPLFLPLSNSQKSLGEYFVTQTVSILLFDYVSAVLFSETVPTAKVSLREMKLNDTFAVVEMMVYNDIRMFIDSFKLLILVSFH